MHHSFLCRMRFFLLMVSLLGFGGCAAMMETIPAPPDFLSGSQLSGPFDKDIPSRHIHAIKNASLMLDEAVPYIFVRVGMHFESIGDGERSIHFYDRAIDEFRKRNNTSGEGTASSRKISALIRFGNIQMAYSAIQELERKWDGSPLKAFVFYNIGYYHLKKGDYAEARKYYAQALTAISDEEDNPDLLALRRDIEFEFAKVLILADYFPAISGKLCLQDFDAAFYQNIRHNNSKGLLHLEQVAALNETLQKTRVSFYFSEIVPRSMECDVYNLRGFAYGITGKSKEAFKNLETAVSMAKNSDYHLGEADNIFFLNQIYLLDKNSLEGIKAAQALAEIAERHQLIAYSIWANLILAHHYQGTGDVDKTMHAMDKALTLMEDYGSWLSDADFRGIRFLRRQALYETLFNLHAEKGDERGAFKAAERLKAAALADRLSSDVTGKIPAAPENLRKIYSSRQILARHYNSMFCPFISPEIFMDTVGRINQARRDHAQLLNEIRGQDEGHYSIIRVVSYEVEDIQKALDPNTTLFAYYVGEQSLYIWVISGNGFHQERISISRGDVDELVSAYRNALVSREKSRADVLAEKLYDTFLKPVIPFVHGDRVGFVPHGTLYNLPFASMRYVRSYLVDGFTIFHLPHSGLLKQPLKNNSMRDLAKAIILADTSCIEKQHRVALAGEEMDTLKRIFPQADYVVGQDSIRADLSESTGNYDVIHLLLKNYGTGQGLPDCSSRPATTEQCKEGLDIRDIFRLRLTGRVSVLSACQSVREPYFQEGLPVLTSAWLYAVGPSVITQLWEVEDKAKAVLMESFYKSLEKSGSVADALRAAQNEMIQRGYEASDWAAFIMTGLY